MTRYVPAAAFALAAVVLLVLTVTEYRTAGTGRTRFALALVGGVASLAAAVGLTLSA